VSRAIASPNSVPFVSIGGDTAYTVGTRNGRWTPEGLNWTTGASRFPYVIGGQQFNSFFSGIIIDGSGNVIYEAPFGKVRILKH
jgi:hypothetical protein